MTYLFSKKNIHKWLVGVVLGSAIVGVGTLSGSPKGQSFWQRLRKRIKRNTSYIRIGIRRSGSFLSGLVRRHDSSKRK